MSLWTSVLFDVEGALYRAVDVACRFFRDSDETARVPDRDPLAGPVELHRQCGAEPVAELATQPISAISAS